MKYNNYGFDSTLDAVKYLVNENHTYLDCDYFDGEHHVDFEIYLVTDNSVFVYQETEGKLSNLEYELFQDTNGEHYFEYIHPLNKVYLKDFDVYENL